MTGTTHTSTTTATAVKKAATNPSGEKLFAAVVQGNKIFHAVRYVEGVAERYEAEPGQEVMVTSAQMAAFPERLVSREVFDANVAAAEALRKQQEQLAKDAKGATKGSSELGSTDGDK